jgi:hypothetical protein
MSDLLAVNRLAFGIAVAIRDAGGSGSTVEQQNPGKE